MTHGQTGGEGRRGGKGDAGSEGDAVQPDAAQEDIEIRYTPPAPPEPVPEPSSAPPGKK
jgi:hypothetical protein